MIPKLDNEGNLLYTQTGFVDARSVDAALQTLSCRLRLLNGEYLLILNEGIDYQEHLDLQDDLLTALRDELKKDPRVALVTAERRDSDVTLGIQFKNVQE